jgi:hypothetical protein
MWTAGSICAGYRIPPRIPEEPLRPVFVQREEWLD